MLTTTPTPDQTATITRLDALTGPAWTVDAGAIDEPATQACELDSAHGPATVYLPVAGELLELCPACALTMLDRELCSGDWISIDVLRRPA